MIERISVYGLKLSSIAAVGTIFISCVQPKALGPVSTTGLILCLHPANERRRYNVTPSLIGWAQS